MSLLQALHQAGALRSLDHALAQSLRRLDPATPDAVLAGAALASLAVAQGHAGFALATPRMHVDAPLPWPEPVAWSAALRASPWVDTPATAADASRAQAPLVLENGLLYLRRYREYERRLALGLQRIAGRALPADAPDELAPLFASLFPPTGAEDHQARAAEAALHHPLLLVTGGPGTGKTRTIARLLVLLVAQAATAGRTPPRIALAAPTGRAAERMAESLRLASTTLQGDGIDPALCAMLPTTGSTLHRLLGTIPESPAFRHDAANPLPLDIVVVDEASMVDLPLMAKLVDAVPDGARLVLLGDPDQLPSVEAGDVLSGVLRAAEGARATAPSPTPATGDLFADATPIIAGKHGAFAAAHVHLERAYRQASALDLAPLARAIREGDAAGTLALLRGGTLAGIHFHEDQVDPLQQHRSRLLAHWNALAEAKDPVAALALAGRLRLLTALREGPQGARTLNARIEALLTGGGTRARVGGHFHGRLLLITENSIRHRLFNGDIGICLRDGQGALAAWFPDGEAGGTGARAFHPAALPAHESAFAMTVHKAQGSEFDEVWLQLPEHDNRVLSRELVYTGITRARRALHLGGSAARIEEALGRHASRVSGLAWRLGVAAPEA
ncbi:exodeoxyribonuclease V subunit alpha [Marilutibacter spongiae]|uniref:RecBCD enzyme subunit RecD n=1 Tax=Marilutibacter spongiae TaxID=2025720 RepID=A0A7W3TNH7_9GAMM|nr:exodeoxyribonuclease V subunit alpha [Lysobacter spongiae]MBB1061595.1 exodeoxyribonuclease V subunit alpha [Lysobacter spongiae]